MSTRVEKVIGALHVSSSPRLKRSHIRQCKQEGHAITYASGLAASYAALVYLKPKRIAITGGYHGVYNTIRVYKQSRDVDIPIIDLDDDFEEGDVAWVETPLNPTGEARDIQYYSGKVRRKFSFNVLNSILILSGACDGR